MGKGNLQGYDSIAALLLDNKEIVSTIREFHYSTTKFCKVVDVIRKKEQLLKAELYRRAFISSKTRDNLFSLIAHFAHTLLIHAKIIGSDILRSKLSRLSQSYLLSLNENELLNTALLVSINAEKYYAEIREYGITHKDLQNLKVKIDDFKSTMNYFNESECFTDSENDRSINVLMLEADKLLNDMDTFVESMGHDHTDFYKEYISKREMCIKSKKIFRQKHTV
ncbi:MAG: hypothetical protein Q8933_15775 [Bacteroidota bacterium]|nr:hypothetical protein [Bacteroidota bacterium]MDP4196363.1 hypothetical protein [Bacteroidota bacterium]